VYEVILDGNNDVAKVTLWQWMVRGGGGAVKQFYPIHR